MSDGKAGRPPGKESKNTRGMKARLKQQFGDDFDVIMMLGANCMTLHNIAKDHRDGLVSRIEDDDEEVGAKYIDASNSAVTAIIALDKLANYLEPKLKSVELKADVDMTNHELTPTQRAARITTILDSATAVRDRLLIDGRLADVDELAGSTDDGGDE